MKMALVSFTLFVAVLLGFNSTCSAFWQTVKVTGTSKDTISELFTKFETSFDDNQWEHEFRRTKYMRVPEDNGWQLRMHLIQAAVKQGSAALPAIMESLESDHVPTRILAAQTLSYLAADADIDAVAIRFLQEQEAAVRLYLVDTLGMSGKGESVDWPSLTSKERNRDVRKHVNYAKERKDAGVNEEVLKRMVDWDATRMNTAEVGKLAPDFSLAGFDGKSYRLGDYRGKQPVILVFVYGDT